MKKSLFVGDINVDVIMGGMQTPPTADREVVCNTFDVTLGSAAVIAAAAYTRLGGRAAFAGLAGRDDYGDFMLRSMKDIGIDTRLVRRTSRARTGVTVNLIHGRQRTQVTYPGTIAAFDGADITVASLRRFRHIHFAGPYQQTKLRPHIARLLMTARQMGLTTSLDPQWDMTGKWDLMDEWLPLLSFFFPNRDEVLSITGAGSLKAGCRALAARTACPVIKAGRDGAMIWQNGKAVTLPTPDVNVVDTTGAGDSFDAGFLYAMLDRRMGLRESVEFANAVAARSCMFVGGVNARSTYEDVMRLMEQTQ